MLNDVIFFVSLGRKVRKMRIKRCYSLEDMSYLGFEPRHWQQIESGRRINVRTLLKICNAFRVRLDNLVRGLDNGVYEYIDFPPSIRQKIARSKEKKKIRVGVANGGSKI